MKLTVVKIDQAEVYRDIIRIHEDVRLDRKGRKVDEGHICRVHQGPYSSLAWVRGDETAKGESRIQLDALHRKALHVQPGEQHDFHVERAGLIGRFCWAYNATEIAYRYSTRMAALGLGLGIVGLILGIISIT